jgi:hypothetical protein
MNLLPLDGGGRERMEKIYHPPLNPLPSREGKSKIKT